MGERGTILVLPGGGYRLHAPHEAEPVAAWLEDLGWRTRIVRYPVATRHPAPLATVQREVAAARADGAARVGVIGFSAGGHLAGHAALAPESTPDERPDFALLGYPVVSMVRRPHAGSRLMLVGDASGDPVADDPRGAAVARALSLETLVRADSPPFFLWHTADDAVVPVQHTYLLAAALADAGVPHEVHVFPSGAHGLSLAAETDAAAWTMLAAAWLARLP